MRVLVLALQLALAQSRVYDFQVDGGALPDDSALATALKNGAAMNASLAALKPGDELHIPNKTFHLMGGVVVEGLDSVVIRIDGTLKLNDDMSAWPRYPTSKRPDQVIDCFYLHKSVNLTITSSGVGTLDGTGATWWGIPGIGYLERQENRPKLLVLDGSKGVLVENLRLINSPYWTFWAKGSDGLEVRYVTIDARRTSGDSHSTIDLTAFNTDGFDVAGTNVWIHDCTVWNQDDCVCVKGTSSNMLFERIHASGVGLTIGSIGHNVVRNITFRNMTMHNTYKGIYMKFNGGADTSPGIMEDVLYEDIVMESPEQWPIWIGPAQQSDSLDLCAAHPCSICWPEDPFATCDSPALGTFHNVTLRRVTINSPKYSPGVLQAPATSPATNITFDSVVVNDPPSGWQKIHQKEYYRCENFDGVATGDTTPVPPCFKDLTHAALRRERAAAL